MPRLPKPPGTNTPSAERSACQAASYLLGSTVLVLGSRDEESTQDRARRRPTSRAACCSALTTLVYASGLPTYLPTKAMDTSCVQLSTRSAMTCQSSRRFSPVNKAQGPRGTVGATWSSWSRLSFMQIRRPTSCSASRRGTLYKLETSCIEMTQSGATWQNKESFLRVSASTIFSDRHIKMSGLSPASRSSFTECWQGLVFCSPVAPITGNMPRCTIRKFSAPTLNSNC
mmetsp:Transcript_68143/g.109798  ORF Transcript_68143/g.109798 Transcript_68143/m.109798 type:complete len:229 (-) Transcript_68143:664-1350(-)